LAADIDRYLSGRPLKARKATAFYLVRKRLARNRTASALTAAGCGLAIAMAVGLQQDGWLRDLLTTRITLPPVIEQARIEPSSESQPASVPASRPATADSPAQVIPARSRADVAWEHVKDIDRGQGLGERLDAAAALRRTAQDLYDQSMFNSSLEAYQRLDGVCGEIRAMDAARQKAARARQAAIAATATAEEAGARLDAPDLWARMQTMMDDAQKRFDASDFSGAEPLWAQAADNAEAALVLAKTVAQIRAARLDYEEALRGHDLARLDSFGGPDWMAVQGAQKRAAAAARGNDAVVAAREYAEAKRLLPGAEAAAAQGWKKAEALRVKPQVDQHVAKARELAGQNLDSEALDELRLALALNKEDPAANDLRTGILKNDIDGSIALGMTLAHVKAQGTWKEAVATLSDAAQMNILVKWSVLEAAGFDPNKPVKIDLKSVTIEKAMAALCGQASGDRISLDYELDGGGIVITTAEDFRGSINRVTKTYSTRPDKTRTPLPMSDQLQLVEVIQSTIDPTSWVSKGGRIGKIELQNGYLIITQTKRNHRLIAPLLKSINKNLD
jgi:hypothetical protein